MIPYIFICHVFFFVCLHLHLFSQNIFSNNFLIHCRYVYRFSCSELCTAIMIFVYVEYSCLCSFQLKLSADIEEISGPKRNSCQSFSICQWNANSMIAHNVMKTLLLQEYLSVCRFDVICISVSKSGDRKMQFPKI